MYTEQRPWGVFDTLYDEDTYKVKRIYVNPNQSFSLQYHNQRWEDWIVVQGSGIINDGWEERNCIIGDRFHIPPKNIHRATGGPDGLTFIEVQRGFCDETDIVRLQDSYGRVAR